MQTFNTTFFYRGSSPTDFDVDRIISSLENGEVLFREVVSHFEALILSIRIHRPMNLCFYAPQILLNLLRMGTHVNIRLLYSIGGKEF